MSSIRLLKDTDGRGKAGEIVSAPFGAASDLVKAGIAEYPSGGAVPKQPVKAAPTPTAERHAADISRLNATHAATLAQVRADADAAMKQAEKDHASEIAMMQADLDAAHKQITDLHGDKKVDKKK